jgi:hypothetical protein
MKNPVIASPSFNYAVITTIVYALLYPIFFEMDNVLGEGANFVVVDNDKTTMMYSQQQQVVEQITTECKSPCPSGSEMCITMCK